MEIELIDARTTQKPVGQLPDPSDEDFLTTVTGNFAQRCAVATVGCRQAAGFAPVGWTERRPFHSFVRGF